MVSRILPQAKTFPWAAIPPVWLRRVCAEPASQCGTTTVLLQRGRLCQGWWTPCRGAACTYATDIYTTRCRQRATYSPETVRLWCSSGKIQAMYNNNDTLNTSDTYFSLFCTLLFICKFYPLVQFTAAGTFMCSVFHLLCLSIIRLLFLSNLYTQSFFFFTRTSAIRVVFVCIKTS